MDKNEKKVESDYIPLLLPFKDKITSAKEWDIFVKDNHLPLPSSANIIYKYGSWNKVKSLLGLKVKTPYKIEDIKILIKKHRVHMLSRRVWDNYALQNDLPSSRAIIEAFGKWSEAKAFVDVHEDIKRAPHYSKEDIKKVLLEHGHMYENQKQWNIYAEKQGLPMYNTIKTHFTYEEMVNIINKPKARFLDKEYLIKIALKNRETFFPSSMKSWDEYAKEKKLPKSTTFYKKFGTWKKAKTEVIKALDKRN